MPCVKTLEINNSAPETKRYFQKILKGHSSVGLGHVILLTHCHTHRTKISLAVIWLPVIVQTPFNWWFYIEYNFHYETRLRVKYASNKNSKTPTTSILKWTLVVAYRLLSVTRILRNIFRGVALNDHDHRKRFVLAGWEIQT